MRVCIDILKYVGTIIYMNISLDMNGKAIAMATQLLALRYVNMSTQM